MLKQISVDLNRAVVVSQPTPSNKLVRRDASNLPKKLDPECDAEIPRRVFSAWKPVNGPRAIVRALTANERSKLEARWLALREALMPFGDDQEASVNAEIAAAFGGFRAMRQQDEDVEAVIRVVRAVLREFPLWAIAKGCMLIAQGRAGLDRRYPPNDAQIHEVVTGVVRDYRRSLATAESLLNAPNEQREEIDRPARAEVEAKLGRPIAPKPIVEAKDPPPAYDGKYYQRIADDLEARKARNAGSPP